MSSLEWMYEKCLAIHLDSLLSRTSHNKKLERDFNLCIIFKITLNLKILNKILSLPQRACETPSIFESREKILYLLIFGMFCLEKSKRKMLKIKGPA